MYRVCRLFPRFPSVFVSIRTNTGVYRQIVAVVQDGVEYIRGLSLPNKLNVELLIIPMLSIAVPNTINTQIFTAEKRFLSNVSRLPLPCRPVHEDYLFPKKYAVKFTAVLNTRLDVYLGVSFPNLFVM